MKLWDMLNNLVYMDANVVLAPDCRSLDPTHSNKGKKCTYLLDKVVEMSIDDCEVCGINARVVQGEAVIVIDFHTKE